MVILPFVGWEKSIHALNLAMQHHKRIVPLAQRSPEADDPAISDLYTIGTLPNVLQLLHLPDGTVKVLVEGSQRAVVHRFTESHPCFIAEVVALEPPAELASQEMPGLMRLLLNTFEQYVKINKKIPSEILSLPKLHRVS